MEGTRSNHLQILGVGEDATVEDIERAFKRRARTEHPDRSKSEERYKILREAYEAALAAARERVRRRRGNVTPITAAPSYRNVGPKTFFNIGSQFAAINKGFGKLSHRLKGVATFIKNYFNSTVFGLSFNAHANEKRETEERGSIGYRDAA